MKKEDTAPPTISGRFYQWLVPAAVVLATLTVFLPALENGFGSRKPAPATIRRPP